MGNEKTWPMVRFQGGRAYFTLNDEKKYTKPNLKIIIREREPYIYIPGAKEAKTDNFEYSNELK